MTENNLLVTQLLTPSENFFLTQQNISFIEVPMIEIEYLSFNLPKKLPDFLLISSQNAVKSLCSQFDDEQLRQTPVIVVGRQTKALLEAHGWSVAYCTDYARDLQVFLQSLKHGTTIWFICGELRTNVLEQVMQTCEIAFQTLVAYTTVLKSTKVTAFFNAVIFFSPSAVKSFNKQNLLPSARHIFCIGHSTAKALNIESVVQIPKFPSRMETLKLYVNQLKGLSQ